MENIDTLVLSGGGIKCISILGSLSYLIQNKIIKESFKDLKNIYYTSGSSIFTFPILLGFSIESTIKIFEQIDYVKFTILEELSLNKLLSNFGLSNSEKFSYIIEIFLEKKGIKKDITLKEFYELNKININYLAINITKDKYEKLNHINYPDLSVVKAICITSNIPILFEPIEYNGSFYIDAGIIESLDYKELCENKKSLGIDIITTNISFPNKNNEKQNTFEGLKEYLNYLYDIYGARLCYNNLDNHIKINIPGCGANFDDFKNTIKLMVENGYKSTEEYFKHRKQIDSENQSNEGQKGAGKN